MKPRLTSAERCARIVAMHQQGRPRSEIAQEFGISTTRVEQIIKNHVVALRREQENEAFLVEVRRTNDVHHHWATTALIAALGFHIRAENALIWHFNKDHRTSISLTDLLDALISTVTPPHDDLWAALPVYTIRRSGKITAGLILGRLLAVNLGPAFAAEWVKRLDNLRTYMGKHNMQLPHLARLGICPKPPADIHLPASVMLQRIEAVMAETLPGLTSEEREHFLSRLRANPGFDG